MDENEKPSTNWYVDPATGELIDLDDAPELDDDWFAEADLYEGDKLIRRGRPRSQNAKQLISLRLSPQVLEHFRATGPGWHTRINDVLLRWVESQPKP